MANGDFEILSGAKFAAIANRASDFINSELRLGNSTDEVVCILVRVAADYAAAEYGLDYLEGLAHVLRESPKLSQEQGQ
uniref:Uncharacterized protein n=1 Tax=Rhodopseudomonas palustris (strain DX-1) TaxID=652103 RepID=E6VFJ2_RHOPX